MTGTSHAPIELVLDSCGDSITIESGRGALDEAGHRCGWYHQAAVIHRQTAVAVVRQLHTADVEQIVPLCRECRKQHPCPTAKAVKVP